MTEMLEQAVEDPAVQKLIEYVSRIEFKFKREGEWYFRGSWIGPKVLHALKDQEVISEEGTLKEVRESGIEIPESRGYTEGAGLAKIYKINDKRINGLIR